MRWRILGLMTGAQAGASIVQQGIGSLAPFILAAFALNEAQFGLLFMSLQIGSACFTAPAGVFVDRYGERRVVLVSGSLMAAALGLASLLPSFPWFATWMCIFGMAYAATTPAGGRAVLGWFSRDRGLAMGIRQTGVPIGGFLGATLLPVIAAASNFRIAIACAAVVTLTLSLTAARWFRDPPSLGEAPAERQTWRDLGIGLLTIARDRRAIFLTAMCMILTATQYTMNAFLTVTAVTVVRTDVHTAALAFALAQVFAIGGRLGWGWVSDHLFGGDRVAPMIVICGVSTVALLGIAACRAHTELLLFASSALLGLSGAGWNGLFAAAFVEIGGARRAGTALGIPLTGIFLAGAAAPPIIGAIADASSFGRAWTVLAIVSFLGIVPGVLARVATRRAAQEAAYEGT